MEHVVAAGSDGHGAPCDGKPSNNFEMSPPDSRLLAICKTNTPLSAA